MSLRAAYVSTIVHGTGFDAPDTARAGTVAIGGDSSHQPLSAVAPDAVTTPAVAAAADGASTSGRRAPVTKGLAPSAADYNRKSKRRKRKRDAEATSSASATAAATAPAAAAAAVAGTTTTTAAAPHDTATAVNQENGDADGAAADATADANAKSEAAAVAANTPGLSETGKKEYAFNAFALHKHSRNFERWLEQQRKQLERLAAAKPITTPPPPPPPALSTLTAAATASAADNTSAVAGAASAGAGADTAHRLHHRQQKRARVAPAAAATAALTGDGAGAIAAAAGGDSGPLTLETLTHACAFQRFAGKLIRYPPFQHDTHTPVKPKRTPKTAPEEPTAASAMGSVCLPMPLPLPPTAFAATAGTAIPMSDTDDIPLVQWRLVPQSQPHAQFATTPPPPALEPVAVARTKPTKYERLQRQLAHAFPPFTVATTTAALAVSEPADEPQPPPSVVAADAVARSAIAVAAAERAKAKLAASAKSYSKRWRAEEKYLKPVTPIAIIDKPTCAGTARVLRFAPLTSCTRSDIPFDTALRLKAITLRQPWASAVMYGGKNVENRTWPIAISAPHAPESPAGTAVASGGMWAVIHAGATYITELEEAQYQTSRIFKDLRRSDESIPRSAILGLAHVSACVDSSHPFLRHNRWVMPGHMCWYIDAVYALPQPIPDVAGKLQLWSASTKSCTQIWSQLDPSYVVTPQQRAAIERERIAEAAKKTEKAEKAARKAAAAKAAKLAAAKAAENSVPAATAAAAAEDDDFDTESAADHKSITTLPSPQRRIAAAAAAVKCVGDSDSTLQLSQSSTDSGNPLSSSSDSPYSVDPLRTRAWPPINPFASDSDEPTATGEQRAATTYHSPLVAASE